VLESAQTRALSLINKGVDLTPTVQLCCGACRTCVTTNVLTLVGGAALYVAGLARRFFAAQQPLGAPAPFAEQAHLGHFYTPQRGNFAIGRVIITRTPDERSVSVPTMEVR
jgi:hypothetical protein